MLMLGTLHYTSRGVDLLASLGNYNLLFTLNKNMRRLVFLIISSTPSLKIYCTNFKPLFLAESTSFHCFSVFLTLLIACFVS